MLLGSMGLVVVPKGPKLYGLVRKPLATLHSAAETTSPRFQQLRKERRGELTHTLLSEINK